MHVAVMHRLWARRERWAPGIVVCVLALMLGTAAPMWGQPEAGRIDMKAAREVVQQAEKLAAGGQKGEALKRVETLVRSDRPREPAVDSLLYFSLGWLSRDLAATQPGERTTFLTQAATYYQRVLQSFPGHIEATENLAQVLRELGRPTEAIAVLGKLQPTNEAPARTYSRLLALGDLHLEAKQPEEALAAYDRAFTLTNSDARAPWRIVETYSKLPESWTKQLFGYCGRFTEAGMLPPASRGYEEILRRQATKLPALAAESLELWVEVEARLETLSADSVARLPEFQTSPALRELMPRIDGKISSGPAFDYWRGNPFRRHICSTALRSLAQRQRAAAQPDRAEVLCREAMDLAPDFSDYSRPPLAGRPFVGLDAALDLASLYRAYPKLDATGQKFRWLEDKLMLGKNESYLQGNLPAKQKYHTVLGLIYADRGQWQDSLQGAAYHLQRAVSTAREGTGRTSQEYQPLPHLTKLLADGLTTNAQPNLEKARSLYVQCAQGFLDADDLRQADVTLQRAIKISDQLRKPPPAEYLELKKLLDTRKNVSTLQRKDFQSRPDDAKRKIDPSSWLAPGSAGGTLDPAFLNRQRFRALDDLSASARKAGAEPAADHFWEQAEKAYLSAPGATQDDARRVKVNSAGSTGSKLPVLDPAPLDRHPKAERLLTDPERKAMSKLKIKN